jgi:hypothetical protein
MSKQTTEATTSPEAAVEVTLDNSVTPFQLAALVNGAFEAQQSSLRIPPQMMYNYTTSRINKGQAPYIAVHPFTLNPGAENERVSHRILKTDAEAFVASYVAKKLAKEAAKVAGVEQELETEAATS